MHQFNSFLRQADPNNHPEGFFPDGDIKSFVDYDSFEELKSIVSEFKPDLIGIRTLSFFKHFFSDTIKSIRELNPNVPIIVGGPHPTIDHENVLFENDIQAVIIGEGELPLVEILTKMIKNKSNTRSVNFPSNQQLSQIKGIARAPPPPVALQNTDGLIPRNITAIIWYT